MFAKTLLGAALAAFANAQIDLEFTSDKYFSAKDAAFINLGKWETSEDFLIFSSFGAMTSGHVWMVPGIKDAVINNDVALLKTYKLDTASF